jgi:agmatinase
MRRISALYGTSSFELGVDRRESITIAAIGDVFTIPGNIGEVVRPDLQGGVPCLRLWSAAGRPRRRPLDRVSHGPWRGRARERQPRDHPLHVDTQQTDLDERMHTTPWYHATDIPNVPAKNLVQLRIGGWQAPRPGVKVCREIVECSPP